MSAECSCDTLGTILEGERDRGRRGKVGQGARLHADNGGSLTRRCGTSGSGEGLRRVERVHAGCSVVQGTREKGAARRGPSVAGDDVRPVRSGR